MTSKHTDEHRGATTMNCPPSSFCVMRSHSEPFVNGRPGSAFATAQHSTMCEQRHTVPCHSQHGSGVTLTLGTTTCCAKGKRHAQALLRLEKRRMPLFTHRSAHCTLAYFGYYGASGCSSSSCTSGGHRFMLGPRKQATDLVANGMSKIVVAQLQLGGGGLPPPPQILLGLDREPRPHNKVSSFVWRGKGSSTGNFYCFDGFALQRARY